MLFVEIYSFIHSFDLKDVAKVYCGSSQCNIEINGNHQIKIKKIKYFNIQSGVCFILYQQCRFVTLYNEHHVLFIFPTQYCNTLLDQGSFIVYQYKTASRGPHRFQEFPVLQRAQSICRILTFFSLAL